MNDHTEEKTIVKYILLTICNRTVRVAIGIQPNHVPLVYWMDKEDHYPVEVELEDGKVFTHNEYFSPYIMFEGALTEKEGEEILSAAESNDYAKAVRLFRKYFRGEDSDKVYVEDEETRPISEEVHDDWYDECKEIMSLMKTNIRDVLTYERQEEYW